MLDKIKIILVLELLIKTLRIFFPELDLGNDFEGAMKALIEALYTFIPIIVGWRIPESAKQVAKLRLR